MRSGAMASHPEHGSRTLSQTKDVGTHQNNNNNAHTHPKARRKSTPQVESAVGTPGKPKLKGNNRYGTKGIEKCKYCRKLKRACEFQDPKDKCELCLSQNRRCGEKILKSQETLDPLPEPEVKREADDWDEKEQWLPKLEVLTRCTPMRIVEKINAEYSTIQSNSAAPQPPLHPPAYVVSTPTQQYMSLAQVTTDPYGTPYHQPSMTQSIFQNPQSASFAWPQNNDRMQLDPITNTINGSSNMSNALRAETGGYSTPSLAPPPNLPTRVTIGDNSIDPRLLSVHSQAPLHPSQLLGLQVFQAEGMNGSNQVPSHFSFNPNFMEDMQFN